MAIVAILLVWWLLQRLVEVEGELEPNLDLDFYDGPPFEITEPMNASGHAQRFFRVKVTNTSLKDRSNCLVMLDEMKAEEGQIYPNRYVPVGLTTDHQLLTQRRRGGFNLRGKQYKFIVVACMDDNNPDSQIALMYGNKLCANTVPRNTYLITLVAYGGGLPKRKDFHLSVDANGFLKMQTA